MAVLNPNPVKNLQRFPELLNVLLVFPQQTAQSRGRPNRGQSWTPSQGRESQAFARQAAMSQKIEWKGNVLGTRATATESTAAFRGSTREIYWRIWRSITGSGQSLEPEHQEAPDMDHKCSIFMSNLFWTTDCQKHLTWAKEKKNVISLTGPKSSFESRVNLVFHLQVKVPESAGWLEKHWISIAWSMKCHWWFGFMPSAAVGPPSKQTSTRKL